MRNIKTLLYGLAVFLCCAICFSLIQIHMNAQTIPFPVTDSIEIETTEETEAEPFKCAVMVFTEEEADALLRRFEDERRAAEEEARRLAEEQAAREAAARRSSFAANFKVAGVLHWGGWRWTWYSEKILPGNGLHIPGRHTDAYGFVRDGDGYLCLASDKLSKGTILDTPLGELGKIYDSGCGMVTIDVYVGW